MFCVRGEIKASSQRNIWADFAHAGTKNLVIPIGFDLVSARDAKGFTPLHIAAQAGNYSNVEFLLKQGCDQTLQTNDGLKNTALMLAIKYYSLSGETIERLLEKITKEGINLQNNKKKTAFYYLVSFVLKKKIVMDHDKFISLVKLFFNKGALVRLQNHKGVIPLHLACKYSDAKLVNLLIMRNRNSVKVSDYCGNNSLHYCSSSTLTEKTIELLLDNGADVFQRNDKSLTPKQLARSCENEKLANVFSSFSGEVYNQESQVIKNDVQLEPVIEVPVVSIVFEKKNSNIQLTTKPAKKTIWDEFIKKTKQPSFEVLKSEIKKFSKKSIDGIPSSCRFSVWSQASQYGARALHEDDDKYKLNLRKKLNKNVREQITKDVIRTFKNIPKVKQNESEFESKLTNILIAYANYDFEVSYCQGMNFIAGIILLAQENWNEQSAFFLFVNLLNSPFHNLRCCFLNYSSFAKTVSDTFDVLLKKKVPKIAKRFSAIQLWSIHYYPAWITTLFSGDFPLEFTFRVWDLVFFYGSALACFMTALAFMKTNKDGLKNIDQVDALVFLKNFDVSDTQKQIDKFMKTAKKFENVKRYIEGFELK